MFKVFIIYVVHESFCSNFVISRLWDQNISRDRPSNPENILKSLYPSLRPGPEIPSDYIFSKPHRTLLGPAAT